MKNLYFALVMIGLLGSACQARGYSDYGYQTPTYKNTYDYSTGNSYNTSTDGMGNSQVRGMNMNTGSMWNTNIRSNGDMSGTDSNSNYWTYNRASEAYYNYGTGQNCIGHGYARTCN